MLHVQTEPGVRESADETRETEEARGALVTRTRGKYFLPSPPSAVGRGSVLSGDDDVAQERPDPVKRRRAAVSLSSATAARDGFGDLVEVTNPIRSARDIILNKESIFTLLGIADEVRHGDDIRRHGIRVRSKLLFCGPPGCGKSLCAEVVASELGMPLVTARLDALIASHLGETAGNLRRIFDAARSRSMVLFLDEFDALARARSDTTEHSEIRRVVNSLLMMIDRFDGRSILIAATNLEETIDRAIWRRFDEIIMFERPSISQIRRLLRMKTQNFRPDFDIGAYAAQCSGMSFAQVERACLNAIRSAILLKKKTIPEHAFQAALEHEIRRAKIEKAFLD